VATFFVGYCIVDPAQELTRINMEELEMTADLNKVKVAVKNRTRVPQPPPF
jgi:hypothetical protein